MMMLLLLLLILMMMMVVVMLLFFHHLVFRAESDVGWNFVCRNAVGIFHLCEPTQEKKKLKKKRESDRVRTFLLSFVFLLFVQNGRIIVVNEASI